MGTSQSAKTELFAQWLSGALVIADQSKSTGRRVFVHSGTGVDAGGYGASPDKPVATIDYAIGLCTDNEGDVIYVMPGHAETLTTAITVDVVGVRIIGLGTGLDRPELTVGANGIDGITITADGVVIDNLYFNEASVATAAANINIGAANAEVRRVHMDMGANDRDGITITAAGEKPTIEDCSLIVTANGPDTWITLEGVIDMPTIRRNRIIGCDGTNVLDDGVIDFGALAITNPIVVDNDFDGADQVLSVLDDVGAVVGDCFAGNRYAGLATDGDTVTLAAASLADGAITAAKIANDAIGATEIADAAIDAATFAADALQAMQDEAEDALEGENLDHLAKTAVANNADMTAEVADGTILSNIMAKGSDTSDYDPATDALEMLSDKAGAFTGDGGAAQDDSVKASLDLAHTDLDAILADTGTDGVAIADGYITAAKFGASAIDSTVIAANAIDAAAIAAGAIDADAIADDAIDAGAIAADAITNAKIADEALASEQFALSAGEKTTDGIIVTRATAALPQTTAVALFTVTGHVLLKRILGVVTVQVGNVANVAHLQVNSTGAGATTDICLAAGGLDIDNDVADTMYEITGTFGDAMVATTTLPKAPSQAADIVVPPGTIELECAGNDGGAGRVRWSATYVPMEAGAQIVAA